MNVLRPISYVDEIEGVLDGRWLDAVRASVEEYSTASQSGGKVEHTLVVIGLLMALQARSCQWLPTYLEVADLSHGYDLVWRDALRLHLRRAGLLGRLWLLADASLGQDRFRVRIGCWVSEVVAVLGVGLGQGKCSAVHLFSAFARALKDEVEAAECSAGVGAPEPAVVAMRAVPPAGVAADSGTVEALAVELRGAELHQPQWNAIFASLDSTARTSLVDAMAASRVGFMQFLDDALSLASALSAIRVTNKALGRFATLWRHAFAVGKKRPRVLAVGAPPVLPGEAGTVGDTVVGEVPKLTILGTVLDQELTLRQ
jgi:hypothetical protein